MLFRSLALYPFLEARFTGDKAAHNLLNRPRDVPVRTGIGAMAITFYVLLMIGGGNDIIASTFHLSINQITYTLRTLILVLPPLVFLITKRWCLSLQHSDEELLHHGIESGTIRRLPSGEFVEETVPLPAQYQVLIPGAPATTHALPSGSAPTSAVSPAVQRTRGFFRAKPVGPPVPDSPVDLPQLERSGQPGQPE